MQHVMEYAEVFDQAPWAICVYGVDELLIHANQPCLNLLGVGSSANLVGLDLATFPGLDAQARCRLGKGQTIHAELELSFDSFGREKLFPTMRSGAVWLSVAAGPVRRRGETEIGGYLLHAQDITDHHRADEELRRSESMLAESQRIAHLGSWELDCRENVLRWSDETYRIFGVARDTARMTLETFFERVHPNDQDRVREAVEEALSGEAPYDIEYRAVRPDGTERVLHARGACFRDDSGRPVHSIGTVLDVTERRRAEDALRQSETKFRTLAENSDDVLYTIDAQGRITYVSPQVSRYGYSPAELAGRQFESLLGTVDRPRVAAEFRRSMGTGSPVPSEFRLIGADGSPYWIEERSRVLRDVSGAICGMMGVLRDTTDRKRIEAEAAWHRDRLRSLTLELSLAEERQRKHLAEMLHDELVQTLSVMKMRLSLLDTAEARDQGNDGVGPLREMVDEAIRFTRSLMLNLSHPALYEMGLAAAAEWLADRMATTHGITVTLSGFDEPVELDQRTRIVLFQCIRELLTNVAKHARTDRAEVSLSFADDALSVSVLDRGDGFDVSCLRVANDGSRFGLFSIGERVHYLGGRMDLRSHPGAGTTVTLRMPLSGSSVSEGGGESQ